MVPMATQGGTARACAGTRCPTTEPTWSPKNIGPIAVAHCPSIPARPAEGSGPKGSIASPGAGESFSDDSGGGCPGAAIAASSGRHDSRARRVQSPRPTGTQVRRRPSGATGMPVDSLTFSSATRDSCSTWIRSMGSTLGCDTPPVATLRANERVISHWSGALVPSMFMRSPSSDWNGFPESPGSVGAISSCYDDEAPSGTSLSAVPRTAVAAPVVRPLQGELQRGTRRVRIEAGPQIGIGADGVPVDVDDDVACREAGRSGTPRRHCSTTAPVLGARASSVPRSGPRPGRQRRTGAERDPERPVADQPR